MLAQLVLFGQAQFRKIKKVEPDMGLLKMVKKYLLNYHLHQNDYRKKADLFADN
jgi:hypothetical protein